MRPLLLAPLLAACASPPAPISAPPPDLDLGVTVPDAAGGLCVSTLLDRYDEAHRDAMIDALLAMGVREIRQELLWANVEPARGQWDWTTEDAWVDAATGAGLEVIAMTAYGNPWATSGADMFYPPDDPADFATFAGAAAERYGDRIARFEIWNEPNAGYRFWKVGDPPAISGDPVGYAALFVPAAQAIHAAAPEAEVSVGGTFFLPMGIIGGAEFVAEAAAAQPSLLSDADAVAFHPYTSYPPRVGPEESGGAAGEVPIWEMGEAMRAAGSDLPLLVTEAGWPAWGDVDEAEQADYLVRGFALAQADGVRDYCAYTLEDFADPSNPEGAFGLYRLGATERKPAGEAYARIAQAIDGMDCNGRAEAALALPDGVYAVRWSTPDGTRAATLLWTTSGSQAVSFPASAGLCGAPASVAVSESPTWVEEASCPA